MTQAKGKPLSFHRRTLELVLRASLSFPENGCPSLEFLLLTKTH